MINYIDFGKVLLLNMLEPPKSDKKSSICMPEEGICTG